MTNTPIPPFSNVELQSQAMNYVKALIEKFLSTKLRPKADEPYEIHDVGSVE